MAAIKKPKKISHRLKFVLGKYTAYWKYLLLGSKALSKKQLVGLVESGLIKASDAEKPTLADAYINAHVDSLTGESRKSVRDYALKHIQSHAGKYIDKFTQKAETDLTSLLERDLLQHRNKMISATREELAAGMTSKTARTMAQNLREKTQELYKDWDRVVTTELAEATNLGSFDAIVENNRGVSPDEIYVYKQGPHDHKTCKYCLKFWFLKDGITPKVYKLSELVANGSNNGKKVADWLPTVGVTHPNERHFLLEMRPNWGFVSGGISYIKQGHNEYEHQKGR